jgi:hypothetical protein
MHPRGPRHLRQPANRLFNLRRSDHHEVSKLINDDDNLRKRPVFFIFLLNCIVKRFKVPYTFFRKPLIPVRHLGNSPAKRCRRLRRLRHDRDQKMRDSVIIAQFYYFRVYQDQLDFIRRRFIKDADNDAVDANALSGPCRPCNQHMRHCFKVGGNGIA